MRSLSAYGHRVTSDSFSGGLGLAFEPRARFQHQHRNAALRLLLGKFARGITADLLVRVQLQKHLAPYRNVKVTQGSHREYEKCDACFHVENAGSPYSSVSNPEPHRGQSSQRIHGVGMT